jgi:hypothetical protein
MPQAQLVVTAGGKMPTFCPIVTFDVPSPRSRTLVQTLGGGSGGFIVHARLDAAHPATAATATPATGNFAMISFLPRCALDSHLAAGRIDARDDPVLTTLERLAPRAAHRGRRHRPHPHETHGEPEAVPPPGRLLFIATMPRLRAKSTGIRVRRSFFTERSGFPTRFIGPPAS